jgi:hypothetical protein
VQQHALQHPPHQGGGNLAKEHRGENWKAREQGEGGGGGRRLQVQLATPHLPSACAWPLVVVDNQGKGRTPVAPGVAKHGADAHGGGQGQGADCVRGGEGRLCPHTKQPGTHTQRQLVSGECRHSSSKLPKAGLALQPAPPAQEDRLTILVSSAGIRSLPPPAYGLVLHSLYPVGRLVCTPSRCTMWHAHIVPHIQLRHPS